MSLFRELKRRNVFRVGIAYAVASWVILQLTDVVGEILELPSWGGKLILLIVAIGFPIALIFAWAFELTPEGLKRDHQVDREASIAHGTGKKLNTAILLLLALAVSYLTFDKFYLQKQAPAATVSTGVPASTAMGITADRPVSLETEPKGVNARSIAVLPFTNRSPVAEDEFFIDGIHDDLLTNLSRIGELKVISRTSVARFRDTDTPIPEIARELGVASVMEGAVQRAGNTVRINVQLIDAATDEHLWAQIYDRPLTTENLFAIQSEISEAIASALKATLTEAEEKGIQEQPTANLDAYSAYLRAHRDFGRREVETMQRALEGFRRATALDPEFAHAWAGIAMVAQVMPSWGLLRDEEALAIAEPAARRSLELAPDLGEAHLAMALVLDGEASEEQFKRAIELLPNHAPAYQWYGNQLEGDPERTQEALALFRRSVELDPLSPLFRHQVARFLTLTGQYAEADRELAVINDLDPTFYPALQWRAITQSNLGHLDKAFLWNDRARKADPASEFPVFDIILWSITLQDQDRILEMMDELDRLSRSGFLKSLAEAGLAIVDRRFDAAVEILAAVDDPRFQGGAQEFTGFLKALQGDWAGARAIWELSRPALFEQSGHEQAIEKRPQGVCLAGFSLLKTGEPELGLALVSKTIDFATLKLPLYRGHAAHEAELLFCHAILGDEERTLQVLETYLDHGHYVDWWVPRYMEFFEPLYGDPRFESFMERAEREMTRQRNAIALLDEVP